MDKSLCLNGIKNKRVHYATMSINLILFIQTTFLHSTTKHYFLLTIICLNKYVFVQCPFSSSIILSDDKLLLSTVAADK